MPSLLVPSRCRRHVAVVVDESTTLCNCDSLTLKARFAAILRVRRGSAAVGARDCAHGALIVLGHLHFARFCLVFVDSVRRVHPLADCNVFGSGRWLLLTSKQMVSGWWWR